eukprot:CAMPEP_0180367466 /NCGR_PEP_ID=MMETSP0989-20121125/16861_1 /TAXON_ID=697907 /ORGANISM="non described non described, Strain CCMP2293" /LENGTH=80 /DNA_ID=CAMNT_0022361545 /DNA_START=37 /DNA_END=280 /DNA_ORIENTATION=-
MPPYISYRMVTPRKQGDVTISEEVAARGFNIPTSSLLTTQELRFISGHVATSSSSTAILGRDPGRDWSNLARRLEPFSRI